MFWQSQFFWTSFVIILVLAIICLALAFLIRRKRLENKFFVEIENHGNVASRYLLRLDDPGGQLGARFSANGNRLPTEEINSLTGPTPMESSHAARPGTTSPGDQARSASNVVVQYGPSQVSSPLIQADSTLYEGQEAVGRIQYYLRKLGLSQPGPGRSAPQPTQAARGVPWALTDEIEPGKSLQVEMTVWKKRVLKPKEWSFRLISRAREDEKAPGKAQEGTGLVPDGYWKKTLFVEMLIGWIAILLVVAVALIASVTNL